MNHSWVQTLAAHSVAKFAVDVAPTIILEGLDLLLAEYSNFAGQLWPDPPKFSLTFC
jgi:hypothetical protein